MPRHVGVGIPTQAQEVASSANLEEPAELRSSSTFGTGVDWIFITFIALIVFSDGLTHFNIPGLLFLATAATMKHYENSSNMSKRKRDEDFTGTDELEKQLQHKQRKVENSHDWLEDKDRVVILTSKARDDQSDSSTASSEKALDTSNLNIGNQEISTISPAPGGSANTSEEDFSELQNAEEEEIQKDEDHQDALYDSDEEEDDEMKDFRPILSAISLENIPSLASNLRHQQDVKIAQDSEGTVEPELMDCAICDTPLSGSFNLLYKIEFSDGVTWACRIPAIGTAEKFDQPAARAMENEVLTMRLLKRETTIPIPTIHGYSVSIDNELNCPYILMDFVEGTLLQEKWFDESLSKTELEEVRVHALKEIAEVMIQLGKFQFDEGGTLTFDEGGKPVGIGPIRVIDDLNMFTESYGSVHEVGPFSDLLSAALRKVNIHPQPEDDEDLGLGSLLRLLLSWIPEPPELGAKFVLHHPDCDIQNFIVADDGSILAVIDWTGVCTEPRWIGNESYPIFLTRDLDPKGSLGECAIDCECCEAQGHRNTAEELAKYRDIYLGLLKDYNIRSENYSVPSPISSITKDSILARSLAIYGPISEFVDEVLTKVIGDIRDATATDPRRPVSKYEKDALSLGIQKDQNELDYQLVLEISMAVAAGTLSEDRMEWLRDGFAKLWSV